MKFKILILMLIMLSIPLLSYAHPGRTDANGGHWDRKTGTYHFHTGESVGKNHLDLYSESEYSPFTPPYQPPTKNPYHQDDFLICYIIIFLIALIYVCFIIRNKHFENIESKIDCMRKKIVGYQEQCDNFITNLYKVNENIHSIPKSIVIRDFKLCYKNNIVPEEFIFYKTTHGRAYHKKYNCSTATQKISIIDDYILYLQPCSKCAHNYSIPLWRYKFPNVINRFRKTLYDNSFLDDLPSIHNDINLYRNSRTVQRSEKLCNLLNKTEEELNLLKRQHIVSLTKAINENIEIFSILNIYNISNNSIKNIVLTAVTLQEEKQ